MIILEHGSDRYYAGVGSRETPPNILEEMTRLAYQLEERGWWLRSGGARGADSAFADGVEEKAEIWLPWAGFVKNPNPKHIYHVIGDDGEAAKSVDKYHPKSCSLSKAGRSLMMRNWRQIMPDSEFVVCWTPEGKVRGGSGQVLRIAADYGIPVFNMFFDTRGDILNKLEFF